MGRKPTANREHIVWLRDVCGLTWDAIGRVAAKEAGRLRAYDHATAIYNYQKGKEAGLNGSEWARRNNLPDFPVSRGKPNTDDLPTAAPSAPAQTPPLVEDSPQTAETQLRQEWARNLLHRNNIRKRETSESNPRPRVQRLHFRKKRQPSWRTPRPRPEGE